MVGTYLNPQRRQFGFKRAPAGTLRTIKFPKSKASFANGINDPGVIVGSYEDHRGHMHGYLRS